MNAAAMLRVFDEAERTRQLLADRTDQIPDIITFITSDQYLRRPLLYPRQGTLLKVIFLQTEMLTDYDHGVLDEWEYTYRQTANEKGQGNSGIVPGVRDRMVINRICPACKHDRGTHRVLLMECQQKGCACPRYKGRKWFREVVSAIGRRGSKGHIGALAGAYVLAHYLALPDPQGYYGVDRDKRMTATIFAGKKEQARDNQWLDLNNVIMGAPHFTDFISKALGESLSLRSAQDTLKKSDRENRGVVTDQEIATFDIVPKESTVMAGRGPAGFMQFYDEAAHVVKGVAKATAEDVYGAASPSLDQFGVDAFIYIPSSPWQKIGLFYQKYEEALELEEDGSPVYPATLMIQLASWEIYRDWEIAHTIPMQPGGLHYLRLNGAIQTYDDNMRKIERANPETFNVERRAWFAAVMDAYLNPTRIAEMWAPWPDESHPMTMQVKGKLGNVYRAHGDPSKSGANFGFAIAHIAGHDERGLPHVVFDFIHAWMPGDFEGHEIDYEQIGNEIAGYMDAFMPRELTFDQFNSVSTVQALQRHARAAKYPKQVQIYERPATGPLNWKTWETFKTALGLGLIHAPYFELADLELTFLQDQGGKVDHPSAGPVQTKDVADCLAIVTYELIGEEMSSFIGKALSELSLVGHPGRDPYAPQREDAHEALSAFGRGRRPGIGRGVRR